MPKTNPLYDDWANLDITGAQGNSYYQQQLPPETPYQTQDEALQSMPDWDKLSVMEQFVYNIIPPAKSIVERWPLTKAVQYVGSSNIYKHLVKPIVAPLGKGLFSLLEVPIEFTERTIGLAAQYKAALESEDPAHLEEFQNNLTEAWYAGSLWADTVNAPKLYRDEDARFGLRFETHEDLAGVTGLIQARQRIAQMVDAPGWNFADPAFGDALAQVREDMYNDQGTLQMRAMMQDTFMHIALDPLNWIPIIAGGGIVSKIKRTGVAATQRITPEGLSRAEDILTAMKAVDAATPDELANIAKVETMVADMRSRLVTNKDRFFLALTGANELVPDQELSKVGKILRSRFNPFALTPESRALDLANTVSDNVKNVSSSLRGVHNIDDAITRAATTPRADQWAHMLATVQGRSVQAQMAGIQAVSNGLRASYDLLAPERTLIQRIARILNLTDMDTARMFHANRGVEQIVGILNKTDDGARVASQLTPGMIERIKGVDGLAWNETMYRLKLLDGVAEHTARQSLAMFGLQERGLITKVSNALKSAESLAFLRLNPGFAVRNFLNNEVTMIANGSVPWVRVQGQGTVSLAKLRPEQIGQWFEDTTGFKFARMEQAFSFVPEAALPISGQAGAELSAAERVISDVLNGKPGALAKLQEIPNKILPEKFDIITKLGRWAEANASARASVHGYFEYFNPVWKKTVQDFNLGSLVPDLPEANLRPIENALSGVTRPDQLETILDGNIELTWGNILDEFDRLTAGEGQKVWSPEFVQMLSEAGEQAAREGKWVEFADNVRELYRQNEFGALTAAIDNVAGTIANEVKATGPGGIGRVFHDLDDKWWGHHIAYSREMEMLQAELAINKGADADRLWKIIKQKNSDFWEPMWEYRGALIKGVKEGAAEAGIKIPRDILADNNAWRKETRGLFEFRDKLLDDFFAARAKGEAPKFTFDEITEKVSERYEKLILSEDKTLRGIDEAIVRGIRDQDPEFAKGFSALRSHVADMRLADKRAVATFYDEIKGLPREKRNEAFTNFWIERRKRAEEIWQASVTEKRAMQGVQGASGHLDELARAPGSQKRSVVALADAYPQIKTTTPDGRPFNQHIEATVNKYLAGGYDDLAEEALKSIKADIEQVGADEFWVTINDEELFVVTRDIPRAGIDPDDPGMYVARRSMDDLTEGTAAEWARGTTVDDVAETLREEFAKQFANQNRVARIPGQPERINSIDDISYELAEQAFEASYQWRRARGEDLPPVELPRFEGKPEREFVAGYDDMVNPEPEVAFAKAQHAYTRGYDMIYELERAIRNKVAAPPTVLDDLPPNVKGQVLGHLEVLKSRLLETRFAASRYGLWKRDSALLNYNRRFNYNTMLSTIFPYEFWTTQSIMKWALRAIDRPAMMTTYFRMMRLFEQAGLEQEGAPNRLAGYIRIPGGINFPGLPGMPSWMGKDVFIDPLRMFLPFENFAAPVDEEMRIGAAIEGRASRLIQQWIAHGEVPANEAKVALETFQGSVWDRAVAQVQADDAELRFDDFDFMSMLVSPHAPIVWAREYARGTSENIGPLLPLVRNSKQIFGALGVQPPWAPHNIAANLRGMIGLSRYDKWDEYRVKRMLSNMVGEGRISTDEMMRAFIDKSGPLWEEAAQRAELEFAGGSGSGAILKFLGVPLTTYPEGEQVLRSLSDDFDRVWGDDVALNEMFERHPEYEARLALWKSDDEVAQEFLVDNLWDKYQNLESINKSAVRDALGPEFTETFLDQRSYSHIPIETLGTWLKLLGGDPPGTLNYDTLPPLELAPPDVARVATNFYDIRKELYPNFRQEQETYFQLEEGEARRNYLRRTPSLAEYWDWRREFFHRNPAAVQYLSDNFEFEYRDEFERLEAIQSQPTFTAQEWSLILNVWEGPVISHIEDGDPLPPSVEDILEQTAAQLGLTLQELLDKYGQSLGIAVP